MEYRRTWGETWTPRSGNRAPDSPPAALHDRLARWHAFLKLVLEELDPLRSNRHFARKDNTQAARTFILKLRFIDNRDILRRRGESQAAISSLLHGGEQGLGNFLAHHLPDGSGPKQLAEGTIGLD